MPRSRLRTVQLWEVRRDRIGIASGDACGFFNGGGPELYLSIPLRRLRRDICVNTRGSSFDTVLHVRQKQRHGLCGSGPAMTKSRHFVTTSDLRFTAQPTPRTSSLWTRLAPLVARSLNIQPCP